MHAECLDPDELDEESFAPMSWAVPEYTREQVNAAGRVLSSGDATGFDLDEALYVINNWRSSHSFPLNTFQVGLRRRARLVDNNSIVAQRIKRISSIKLKLKKLKRLTLAEMQDIGGCRAVLKTVKEVRQLADAYEKSEIKHRLDDSDDYITSPKKSGYRGIHLIYCYHSDKKTTYNDLKVEMQLRSTLQHAWATAVETVGTFTGQALKSSLGGPEWLRFFALMGTALAHRERTPPVPGTPTDRKELIEELRMYVKRLDVLKRLAAYGTALQEVERGALNAHYFLLKLDQSASQITIYGFKSRELQRASAEYLAVERAIAENPSETADAVLVSVESVAALRRAYPNYFLDTRVFIDAVRRAVD